MKIRATFETNGNAAVELTAENEGEQHMLALFQDGAVARCILIKDNQRPPYQKILGAKIEILHKD